MNRSDWLKIYFLKYKPGNETQAWPEPLAHEFTIIREFPTNLVSNQSSMIKLWYKA